MSLSYTYLLPEEMRVIEAKLLMRGVTLTKHFTVIHMLIYCFTHAVTQSISNQPQGPQWPDSLLSLMEIVRLVSCTLLLYMAT